MCKTDNVDKKNKKDKINSPKNEPRDNYNLRKREKKVKKKKYTHAKKKITHSDNDSDDDSSSDYNPMEETNEELNPIEYQKFLQKLFPSTNQKDKIKQLEKIENMFSMKEENVKIKKKLKKVKKIYSKKDYEEDSEEEEEEEEEGEEGEEGEEEEEETLSEGYEFPVDEDEELDDDELQDMLKNNMKFNIVFTTTGKPFNEYDDEFNEYGESYDEDETSEEENSDSDEELNKCIKKEEKKLIKDGSIHSSKYKKNENVKVKLNDWDKFYNGKIRRVYLHKTKRKIKYDIALDDDKKGEEYEIIKKVPSKFIKKILKNESQSYEETVNVLEELVKNKKNKGNEVMLKEFEKIVEAKDKIIKKREKKNTKKKKDTNLKTFKKMLKQKQTINDYKYFTTLCLTEQKKILEQLKEVSEYNRVDVPHKLSLLECDIPVEYKSVALKKINTLSYMDPGAGEYYKTKQWVDTFLKIPFNKHNNLPVSMKDGSEKINEFMEKSKKILDDCCYGLNDAKMQIMQIIGQWISNPDSVGNAIALKGPPGTGKTTLIKEGVSKILNRPFAFIPLGGATDSSYLEGHSYTYEGSTWGKIVDILITHKSMNPVFYFDELDKVSQTPKGEEIIGILTHLTDTTQNDKFHDKYFSNIDFDLNKCLFIFSYNDESKINPILKDRMYRIHTKCYNNEEKKIICKKYLMPKIEKNVNFKKEEIIIPDETIDYINTNMIEKEAGVRNMKRAMEIIYTKINLHRLMKKGSTLFDKKETLNISFPFTVTKKIVDLLIKKDDTNKIPFGMYV